MKLSNNNATHLKIPLSQIRETGNVRKDYDANGIAELAESIKNNGLLNPLTVKPGQDDENGNKTYELIAGHRRLRAYQLLCENGDDFSMVECCVRPGKKIVLQMIENIQRQDITPREKEEAVKAMLAEGYTQSDIARELSKPIAWVSDIVAGTKVREVADKNDIDTDGIATKTLSQLRSIPAKELPSKIKELSKRGGTFREATEIMNEAKGRLRVPITPLPDTLEEFQAEMTQKRAAATNVSNDDDDIEAPDITEADFSKGPKDAYEIEMNEHGLKIKQLKLKSCRAKEIRGAWRTFLESEDESKKDSAFDFYCYLLEFFEADGRHFGAFQ